MLNDKSIQPTDELLAAVLKSTKSLWDEVISHIMTTYKNPGAEWKFYSVKSGWTLAVISDKRKAYKLGA